MPTPKQILAAYTQMNKIVAMCVAKAPQRDIDQELNTLSAMTRIRRER